MTTREPTPMPEGISRENRPKAPSAPPKPKDSLYINFRDIINGGFCADIDYESQAWLRVLDDWSKFKAERQEAIARPNDISLEQAFDYMMGRYSDALKELSEK